MNRMKKVLFILIGLTTLALKSHSEHIISIIKLPDTKKELVLSSRIIPEHIMKMPVDSLKLIRNEILARHGYIFHSEELSAYFSKYDWYQPIVNEKNIGDRLSETDRYNISLIISVEIIKKHNLIELKE